MANSKFEYVRNFEQPDLLLPNTWIVVRIDGRAFTKMCAKYKFQKPNDRRALDLMNVAAMAVVTDIPEIIIAYGVSDEYSFVLHKSCDLFERRARYVASSSQPFAKLKVKVDAASWSAPSYLPSQRITYFLGPHASPIRHCPSLYQLSMAEQYVTQVSRIYVTI
ncbi:tRNA(His) guanylyltransferase [Metarhizium anisopliae]|nr:tRNA(His) guanylyltransferase [Metarhizium anisopliae]